MFVHFQKRRSSFTNFFLSFFVLFSFISTFTIATQPAYAQENSDTVLDLPTPGTMITASAHYAPATVVGMTIHPDNALKLDFLIDIGEEGLEGEAFNDEAMLLIKYFLSSLTVPEEELWVNLSPYQEDDIIPYSFGQTEMGRDLLAQDYMLKQLTASLMYPEDELGEEFWNRIQKIAKEKYGTIDINVNTFNKVWIVPDNAVIYEEGLSAYVVESSLKVMLEEDYMALASATLQEDENATIEAVDEETKEINELSSQMVREVLIPEIEKEVNTGKNFAKLRQIYSAMILGLWYKESLKGSILSQVYIDKNKIVGVDVEDKHVKDKIFNQYLDAFKVGVFNYMKVDIDPITKEEIPGKYFSGGFVAFNPITQETATQSLLRQSREAAADPTTPGKVQSKLTKLFPNLRTVGIELQGKKNLPVSTMDVTTVTMPVRLATSTGSTDKISTALETVPQVGTTNAKFAAEAVVSMASEAPEMFHSAETIVQGLTPRLEAKGLSTTRAKEIANTIAQPQIFQKMEAAIGASVFTETAALSTAIKTQPEVKQQLTQALTEVASLQPADAARLATSMSELPATDFSTPGKLRQSLTKKGFDAAILGQVFTGTNISKISSAVVSSKMDRETASMAVAVQVADTNALINVVSEIDSQSQVKLKAQPQSLVATIKTLPAAAFTNRDTFKQALISSNVDAGDARIVSQQKNVRQLMNAVQAVEPSTASLPALIATDKPTVQANIALAISEQSNIDPAKAARYAKMIVDSDIGDFTSRGSLEKALASKPGFDRTDAIEIMKPNVLNKIGIAASSPVDNTFATIVVSSRADRQKSVGNLTAELSDIPEIGGQANAAKISNIIVNELSPTPTRAEFKAALATAFQKTDIDVGTADILVRDDVVTKVRRAVTSPVNYSVAALSTSAPAAASVNLDRTTTAIKAELTNAGVDAKDVDSITAAVLKISPKSVSSTQALQQAFTKSGSSAKSAEIAAQPAVLSKISQAVSQIATTDQSTKTTAPLAAMINTTQSSRKNIVSIVSASNPALDQADVNFGARQLVVMSQKAPQKFITSKQIQQGLVDRDVNPQVAAEIAKTSNLQRIAMATSKPLDNRTASMPAMFQDKAISQGKIQSVYSQMPDISAPQARVMAEEMIKITELAPQSFVSPKLIANTMETRLKARDVAEAPKLAKAAVRSRALRMITQSHDRRMFARESIAEDQKVGGIDFNSANIDLSINRDGSQMPLPVSQELLQNLDIGGFVPVINNVAPMINIPLIYGEADVDSADELSRNGKVSN